MVKVEVHWCWGSQYVSDQTSSILTPDAFELLTLEEWVHYLSVLLISNTKDSIMEIAFFPIIASLLTILKQIQINLA